MKPLNALLTPLLVACFWAPMPSCKKTEPLDDTSGTSSDGDTDTDLHGACPLAEKVGSFKISHLALYSAVTGNVKDGVVPITEEFPLESDGDCMLLQKINPLCDPTCDPDEACDHGDECVPNDCPGVCIPYPRNQNAGTVTITGLTTDVTIVPNTANDYQDTTVDEPPFEPGSRIALTAEGGDVDSFVLRGIGFTPLATDNPEWVIEREKGTLDITSDLEITWTPSGDNAEIYAQLNVDQHGNSPATMHCIFEDDGSATIPISLLEIFTSYGVTGYGSAFLSRRTVDATWIDEGCVQLEVESRIRPNLRVTHHDPNKWPTDV